MTIAEVKTVCFVGAGTMGCYNSLVAAVSGYDVVLYDIDQNTLQQVPQRHAEFADALVAGGYCSQETIPPAMARISIAANLDQAQSEKWKQAKDDNARLAVVASRAGRHTQGTPPWPANRQPPRP